jgi:hypothetical protein
VSFRICRVKRSNSVTRRCGPSTPLDVTGILRNPDHRQSVADMTRLLYGRGAFMTPRSALSLGDTDFRSRKHAEENIVTPRDDRGWLRSLLTAIVLKFKLLLKFGFDPARGCASAVKRNLHNPGHGALPIHAMRQHSHCRGRVRERTGRRAVDGGSGTRRRCRYFSTGPAICRHWGPIRAGTVFCSPLESMNRSMAPSGMGSLRATSKYLTGSRSLGSAECGGTQRRDNPARNRHDRRPMSQVRNAALRGRRYGRCAGLGSTPLSCVPTPNGVDTAPVVRHGTAWIGVLRG